MGMLFLNAAEKSFKKALREEAKRLAFRYGRGMEPIYIGRPGETDPATGKGIFQIAIAARMEGVSEERMNKLAFRELRRQNIRGNYNVADVIDRMFGLGVRERQEKRQLRHVVKSEARKEGVGHGLEAGGNGLHRGAS